MAETIAAHMVVCDNCQQRTFVVDGQNVHDALNCACCGNDHKHGDETGKTVRKTCRSVTVTGNAAVVPALGG
jgi:hypothetical protein